MSNGGCRTDGFHWAILTNVVKSGRVGAANDARPPFPVAVSGLLSGDRPHSVAAHLLAQSRVIGMAWKGSVEELKSTELSRVEASATNISGRRKVWKCQQLRPGSLRRSLRREVEGLESVHLFDLVHERPLLR